MTQYLETDTLRRQANTVVRLTVVTVFGLIGTVATGIFGMNIFGFGDIPVLLQILILALTVAGVTVGLFYLLAKSKRLADFLEAISDERLPARQKYDTLANVWRKQRKPRQ